MTIADALKALSESPDSQYPVVVLRKDRGDLVAAPVLGVALDDQSQDVSLLTGESSEEDVAVEDTLSAAEIGEALQEAGPERMSWTLFAAAAEAEDTESGGAGGSLVGFSASEELEVFAFLQGPKSDWEDD